ncbi:hypothetical protein MBLNU457_3441t1 [Dothideomycetes sp. NU457]
MPPADTPLDSNTPDYLGILPTDRSLTPLSYLSSPVPDLASTLVTSAQDDADYDNIQFLRTPVDLIDDPSTQMSASRPADASHPRRNPYHNYTRPPPPRNDDNAHTTQVDASEHRRNRERMYRVMNRLQATETNPRHNFSSHNWHNYSQSMLDMPLHQQEPDVQEMVRELTRGDRGLSPQNAMLVARSRLDREHDLRVEARSRMEQLRDIQGQERDRTDQYRVAAESNTSPTAASIPRREPVEAPVVLGPSRRNGTLRSAAIMQNARTNNSMDASLRTAAEAYTRDTSPQPVPRTSLRDFTRNQQEPPTEETETSSLSTWQRLARTGGQNPGQSHDFSYPPTFASTNQWRRDILAAHPQNRLQLANKPPQTVVSPDLENAIRYMDRICDSQSYNDSLNAAMDTGFANKEFFADKHDDFIMDVSQIPSPSSSSWLQSGIKFKGSQHTTHQSEPERSTYRPLGYPNNVTWQPEQQPFDATRPWLSYNSVYNSLRTTGEAAGPTLPVLENWPVKVMIHTVDEETMTLSGTMQAYDVPNHTNPTSTTSSKNHDSPITTYLEGHIIDHRTHTLRTPCDEKKHHHRSTDRTRTPAPPSTTPSRLPTNRITFPPTTPTIDAANWRRLPPFSSIESDDEVARVLLSLDRLSEINSQYIFMRWKERCFIHSSCSACPNSPRRANNPNSNGNRISGEGDDTDTGHGLTISGFYYVSLCRATVFEVEGV